MILMRSEPVSFAKSHYDGLLQGKKKSTIKHEVKKCRLSLVTMKTRQKHFVHDINRKQKNPIVDK